MKYVGIALVALVMVFTTVGCISREQMAHAEVIRMEMVEAMQTLDELKPIAARLDTTIRGLIADLKTGKIPVEKFNELYAMYNEQNVIVLEKIKSMQENYKKAEDELSALKQSGTPWWEIVGSILVASLMGGFGVKQKLNAVSEAKQKNAIILGTEKALAGAENRTSVVDAITKASVNLGVADALYASVKKVT